LDEIVAKDCVACGDWLIRSIDRPFITADKLQSAIRTWELVPATSSFA
jgi:hypothetical protein